MQRICSSLARNGYAVTLVGRRRSNSPPLTDQPYRQKRIRCWFNRGKLFYAEYNIRLFFFLLFHRADLLCAIDLDTILAVYRASAWKKTKRVYDAHELFTEMKEVITRPAIQQSWLRIECSMVPRFAHGYTVSEGIAREFEKRYGVRYETIRNMPVLSAEEPVLAPLEEPYIIFYQGAVNEGRCFEQLIPAMKMVPARLVVCGDGNFMPQLKELVRTHGLTDRVILKGMCTPEQLKSAAARAHIGVGIAEREGLNQYLALPNKFFDYIHAGLPQVTMQYPAYEELNKLYHVAVLIGDNKPEIIAAALNNLLHDPVVMQSMRQNCLRARRELHWESEEKKLLQFYQRIFTA